MLISVVIPTYNASQYIEETLASVFAQTRLPDEVIVVDDCSPDDTVEVVERIAATALFPIRVIRLEKNSGGPAHPLNVGIEAARSDLIATLDHDDSLTSNKLTDQVEILSTHAKLGLVFGDLEFCGPNEIYNESIKTWYRGCIQSLPKTPLTNKVFKISSTDAIRAVIRDKCFVATCSNMVFPKVVWKACGGFDTGTTVSCDLAFLAAVCARYDLGYVATASAVWRLHPASFYRTATSLARVTDQLKVYGVARKLGLAPKLLEEWRTSVRVFACESAAALRMTGQRRLATRCLGRAIRTTGPWFGAMVALFFLLVPAKRL